MSDVQPTAAPNLQRVTTQYIELEDRMRLTGEVADDEVMMLWLNHRLLKKLVPHLINWLQKQTAAAVASTVGTLQTEMVQNFAQQAARAEHTPQAPVPVQAANGSWLVDSVDVTAGDPALVPDVLLTFKGRQQSACLLLQAAQLRVWLNILHDQWRVADWPMTIWPDWIAVEELPALKPRLDG